MSLYNIYNSQTGQWFWGKLTDGSIRWTSQAEEAFSFIHMSNAQKIRKSLNIAGLIISHHSTRKRIHGTRAISERDTRSNVK